MGCIVIIRPLSLYYQSQASLSLSLSYPLSLSHCSVIVLLEPGFSLLHYIIIHRPLSLSLSCYSQTRHNIAYFRKRKYKVREGLRLSKAQWGPPSEDRRIKKGRVSEIIKQKGNNIEGNHNTK